MYDDDPSQDWEGKISRCAYCGKPYDQSSGYPWVCSEACSDAMVSALDESDWRL